jgi:hypothetical protein
MEKKITKDIITNQSQGQQRRKKKGMTREIKNDKGRRQPDPYVYLAAA